MGAGYAHFPAQIFTNSDKAYRPGRCLVQIIIPFPEEGFFLIKPVQGHGFLFFQKKKKILNFHSPLSLLRTINFHNSKFDLKY